MNLELLEKLRKDRIRINPAEKIVDKKQAEIHSQETNPINVDDLEKQINAVKEFELETIPRETVLKMFTNKKLEEHFVFRVGKNQGEHYTQAMRQVLSRTRKKALRTKQKLDEFRLLTISIEQKENFDEVTLVRTKQMSEHESSVYDALIDAFKKD